MAVMFAMDGGRLGAASITTSRARRFGAISVFGAGTLWLSYVSAAEFAVVPSDFVPFSYKSALELEMGLLGASALLLMDPVGRYATAPARAFTAGWGLAFAVLFVGGSPNLSEFGDFFGAAAQVLATLLVAVVVEARISGDESEAAKRWLQQGLIVLPLGAIAAVVAMIPGLAYAFYAAAFSLVLGSVFGAVATVWVLRPRGGDVARSTGAPPASRSG
jgi:hypothetical protein